MSAVTDLGADGSWAPLHSRLYRALVDGLVLAERDLVQIPRIPELLVFATLQPVVFALLFRYVFGGAIGVGAQSHVNFLMAGIFAQTVAFESRATGIGLAEDIFRGLVDRFRSLPMARSAVLVGAGRSPSWFGTRSSSSRCSSSVSWSALGPKASRRVGWRLSVCS